jgi:hypothetical protein
LSSVASTRQTQASGTLLVRNTAQNVLSWPLIFAFFSLGLSIVSFFLSLHEERSSFVKTGSGQTQGHVLKRRRARSFSLRLGNESINSEAHQNISYEAALQSLVLLRNDGGALPLKLGSKVAVVRKTTVFFK